jgi:hypothetical protein
MSDRRLRTPRAAAVAGIAFAVLLSASYVLIRLTIPTDPADTGAWLEADLRGVALALSFVPWVGIAFLWFMGVVRDRLGRLEDQFFSTVFLGSGLLFLAMTFASAAMAGGLLASYAIESSKLFESGVYSFGRAVMYRILNIYAIRMAGVFMISLGTIWVRTRVMPRWLALLTYGSALVLLLSISYSSWVMLLFPAWVLVISLYILVLNYRLRQDGASALQNLIPEERNS